MNDSECFPNEYEQHDHDAADRIAVLEAENKALRAAAESAAAALSITVSYKRKIRPKDYVVFVAVQRQLIKILKGGAK